MLLLIIFGSILLLGFVGFILNSVFYNINCKYEKKADSYYWSKQKELYRKYHKKGKQYYYASEVCEVIQYIGLIIGVTTLFLYSIIMLSCRIPIDRDYNDMIYERQVLEYRLDNLDTVGTQTGNELLYNDIVEFNKTLRHAKRYVDNPWIGWFINEKIARLDYIEIDGLRE